VGGAGLAVCDSRSQPLGAALSDPVDVQRAELVRALVEVGGPDATAAISAARDNSNGIR
jgi:hypothetical protein